MTDRHTVVVTGLGATTPLGGDVPTTWEAMLRGDSGITLLEEDLGEMELPALIAGRAKVEPRTVLTALQCRRLSRTAQFAVIAAQQAWTDAGLPDAGVPPRRVAVVVSAALGDFTAIIDGWETLKARGWTRMPPLTAPMGMGNGASAAVSMALGALGGAHATVNACSSGTQALATAADFIRRGVADVVVAGGAEAPVHPMLFGSFATMRALSQRADDPAAASRSFDADRDGLVLGEGSGVVILESAEHARRRGARVYAELAGIGVSSDAFHMVQPDPDGSGDAAAIRAALADAGVAAADVAHLNANGTSTIPGDAAEGRAVEAVFGPHGPALTATKSMTGHSLGAAGAVESIATILAVHHGLVPPTRNFARTDEGVSIDVVHDGPRKLGGDGPVVAVKNSAGFGGHNVALVFRGLPAPHAA